MNRYCLLLISMFTAALASSQEISQVNFAGGNKMSFIALLTDYNVQIRISEMGSAMEWGIEEQSTRNSNVVTLRPYLGRIDYYGNESDSITRGKIRSIGSAVITYYGNTETELKKGKIRTIGRLLLDYFDGYDNKELRGKLRSIGGTNLDYYSSFDDVMLMGKLKTVGSTRITYYTSFDDKQIQGKLKTIGSLQYYWYTSLETRYGGGLKAGPYRQSIGGIVYVLQQ